MPIELDPKYKPYDPEIVSSLADKKVVTIGRFNPLHNGHESMLCELIKKCGNTTIMIGSANITHSRKNPFSAVERRNFIYNMLLSNAGLDKELSGKLETVRILPLFDNGINNPTWSDDEIRDWISEMQRISGGFDYMISGNRDVQEACEKLKIPYLDITTVIPEKIIWRKDDINKLSATDIRDMIRTGDSSYCDLIPQSVLKTMEQIGGIEDRLEYATKERPLDKILEGQPFVDIILYMEKNGQIKVIENIPRLIVPNGCYEDEIVLDYLKDILSFTLTDPYALPLKLEHANGNHRDLRRVWTYRLGEEQKTVSVYATCVPENVILDENWLNPDEIESQSIVYFNEYLDTWGLF